jgi:hypothetical protein
LQLACVAHVVWFAFQELNPFIGKRESREEEGFNWMSKESVLRLLGVFVHDISHNSEVDGIYIFVLSSFVDEHISFAVSMREHNHHHRVDYGHLFVVSKGGLVFKCKDIFSKCLLKELFNEQIHFQFCGGSDSTLLLLLSPLVWVLLLKNNHLGIVELVELLFVELSHYSEAGPVEEEIELFVVLFLSGLSSQNFSRFLLFFISCHLLICGFRQNCGIAIIFRRLIFHSLINNDCIFKGHLSYTLL